MGFWDKLKNAAKKVVKDVFSPERSKAAREQKMYGGAKPSTSSSSSSSSSSSWRSFFDGKPTAGQQKAMDNYRSNKGSYSNLGSHANTKQREASKSQYKQRQVNRATYASNARKQFMNATSKGSRDFVADAFRYLFDNTSQKENITGSQFGGITTNVKDTLNRIDEDLRPKSYIEFAQRAAERDTTDDTSSIRFDTSYLLDQKEHDNIIGFGQHIMEDQESAIDWILEGETYDEQLKREKLVQDWYKNSVKTITVWNPETNSTEAAQQVQLTAELPPWYQRNKVAEDWWGYYITYSHDVVERVAQSHADMLEAERQYKKNPYKSAFKEQQNDPHTVNSLFDVLITSPEKDFDTTYENFIHGFGNWWTDYIWRPLKGGHLLTLGGNALMSVLDGLDYAARGFKGFVAGDQALGGTGIDYVTHGTRTVRFGEWASARDGGGQRVTTQRFIKNHTVNDAKFEGQDVYWAKIEGHTDESVRRAQEMFMSNGGYALLMKAHPNEADKAMLSSEDYNKSVAELEANLDKMFEYSDIDWRDIYNDIDTNYFTKDRPIRALKAGIENVKKAYSDPAANFAVDTGNLVGDIFLESVLDPDLMVGGIAKTATKNTVETVARNSIEKGFTAIAKEGDDVAQIMNNKSVRKAVNKLIRRNEGNNIIFKKSRDFLDEINLCMDEIRVTNPGVLDNLTDRQVFRRTVFSDLMDKKIDINGKIIAADKRSARAFDSKMFKSMYYMDKAIDHIDSAILKSSFFIPWAAVKAGKAGVKTAMNSSIARTITAKRTQRLAEALTSMVDERTGKVSVLKISDVADKHAAGVVLDREYRVALQETVDQYDDVARRINHISEQVRAGDITDEDGMRLIRESVSDITGGEYKDVRELAGYVEGLDVRYAGDIKRSSNNVIDAFHDFENLVDNGAERSLGARLTDSATEAGLRGVSNVSERTIQRKVNYKQFTRALHDAGISLSENDKTYGKLLDFVTEWEQTPHVLYNTSDLIKRIDRFERSVQFNQVLQTYETVETASLRANAVVGEFNSLRRKIKQIDMISIKHGDVVYLMHSDRMGLYRNYASAPEVRKMYGDVNEQVLQPLLRDIRKYSTEDAELAYSSLVSDIYELSEIAYGFDRTNRLIRNLEDMDGIKGSKLNTVINGIANNFGYHGDLQDLVNNPAMFRHQLETNLRARTGESKISMRAITEQLESLLSGEPSEFLEKYSKEIELNPELGTEIRRILDKDPLDPTAYVEKQMLYVALADPSIVRDLDGLAEMGRTPMGFHINTTGLSTEMNNVTSVSFRKWVPVNLKEGEELTLERLMDAFKQGETTVIQRRMTDAEIENEVTEQVLRRLGMRDVTRTKMLERYKAIYGVTDSNAYKSEEDVIREACQYLRDNSIVHDINGMPALDAAPLLVHDLDGFNIPFFTNKARGFSSNIEDANDPIINYINNLSTGAKINQINTYERLAPQVGDHAYTDSEIRAIIAEMQKYADQMRKYGYSYQFMDMRTFSSKLQNLGRTLSNKSEAGMTTELEDRFLDLYTKAGVDSIVSDYKGVVSDIEQLTLKPRGYAFVTRPTSVNPVHAALQAAGQDTVNVESRIYVDDVLAYFDLDYTDGFYASVEDLNKMHQLSDYVVRNRERAIANGAEEYLQRYKAQCDSMIAALKKMALDERLDSTELGYLQNLKTYDNAVDSYLVAKKLYQDHLKYWMDQDILSGIRDEGSALDALKMKVDAAVKNLPEDDPEIAVLKDKLFADTRDYTNSYKRRFMDELTGGGFDSIKREDVQALMAEHEAKRRAFWDNVSDEMKQIWDDLRKANNDVDSNLKGTAKKEQYDNTIKRFEDARTDSEIHMYNASRDYEALQNRLYDEAFNDLDNLEGDVNLMSDDLIALFDGVDDARIFKRAANSDFESRLVRVEKGMMKEGVDVSRKCSNASARLSSNLRQLDHIDSFMQAHGATRTDALLTSSVHRKAAQLFDILHETKVAKRYSFEKFINKASEFRMLQLQQARLNALRNMDGVFDETRLLSELVYNRANMTMFNAYNYSVDEMRELREFVEGLQEKYPYLGYVEQRETGNIYITLNNSVIREADDIFYLNGKAIPRPEVKEFTKFAEFDELKALDDFADIEDIEDFRAVYNHLLSCWDDTRLLSYGAINGTSGRTVSMQQAEAFIKSLPDELKDWTTSEGLLRADLSRDVVYDPGFIRDDTPNILFDFLDTLHRQAAVAREDTLLVESILDKNDNLPFSALVEHFTDDDLMKYFGENSDYVVTALLPNKKTATGFEMRQLKLSNASALQMAKTYEHTTILPYDVYYELSNVVNRIPTDNPARRIFSKYLLVYKAFALIRPGTWMRNYIDATTKAGLDNGEGLLSGTASMLQYEARAINGVDTYLRIAKTDPSLLNGANWDIIQKAYRTDMTFDEFELLRGIIDSNNIRTADMKYLQRTRKARGGFATVSGENIGLRDLEDKDIREAFDKYLSKEPNLPLSKKEFLNVYNGAVIPDETMNAQFEDMMRRLSNNLRHTDAGTMFDNTINNMFKPFGTVENVVRYAQTMYLADNGFSPNQILRHIHNTQFYTAPAWGTFHKLEAIMPFITFKYNNVMYWIRMMDENPRYFKYFEDLYGPIMEDTIDDARQKGSDIDYENDYMLQSGGIPIGSGKVYFNVGNSFMSAMNDFFGLSQDIDSLNPLFKDTVRYSMYALGLQSTEFFSDVDLDVTDEDPRLKMLQAVPGVPILQKAYKTFKNIQDISDENNGPTMDTLFETLNFLGVLGIRRSYDKSGKFSFEGWQEELAEHGKWYDCNTGKIVDISQKNESGANDPNNTFEDTQAYMLLHHGKLWDANQRKFVTPDEYIPGGFNKGFDWENNPEQAWADLKSYMAGQGKYYDYNQRKFVYAEDFINGGLNDSTLDFDRKAQLMEEKFGLYWDGNRNRWVDQFHYTPWGLNDPKYKDKSIKGNFREIMGLRLALFGETYDKENKEFVKTEEPQVVTLYNEDEKLYDNYYSRLALPRLDIVTQGIHLNAEGLLVTEYGKYVLTGNAEHDARVFEKFKHTFDYVRRGRGGRRHYRRWKNYSFNKTQKQPKPHKTVFTSTPPHYQKKYYTGWGWNEDEGYYRWNYQFNYQYHSPQPGRVLHRLLTPPRNYPYGGGYGKFSFYSR